MTPPATPPTLAPPRAAAEPAPPDWTQLTDAPPGRSGRTWLALAIVIAAFLVITSAWRQGWFTPTTHVYLELAGAAGVQPGTPVRLKGFKIGEVDDVLLEDDLRVRVRLRLDSSKLTLLGGDASARMGRDSPISGKFIELQPGARQGPRLAAGQTLPVDGGTELEDVMATVKTAVDKLSTALAKIDPILDDTRKLTGEAVAMRETVRSSLTATLANIQAMSLQFRQASESTRGLITHIDSDRAQVVGDVRTLLRQADAAAASAGSSLKTLDQQLPPALARTRELLDNARDVSADVKSILRESRQDIPVIVRSGRTVAQDASEITNSLKNTWPLSSGAARTGAAALPLDSFEVNPP